MYLSQIRLQRVACFDDVTLDFTDDKGEPCRWVVILGENGAGKSTILQAIAAALPIKTWMNNDMLVNVKSMLRANNEVCLSDLSMVTGMDDAFHDKLNSATVSWSVMKKNVGNSVYYRTIQFHVPGFEYESDDVEGGWFAVGYRPWRGGKRFIEAGRDIFSDTLVAPKIDRVASLYDDYSKLTSIREWLADLDYRQLKERGGKQVRARAALELAIKAIESVLPNPEIKYVEITPTKDVVFEENGIHVSIDSLSDGYRSAMAWIGDLTRRLVEAFPDKENPLEAQGVVLVDEIDLHLHPKWQRTIVTQIRKVFPNLQFIVTTHSPFIAQDMTENDKLIVLKREGDHVTVTEDKGFVSGWRADQILTSYLFGLESTRNTDVASAEEKRNVILNREAQVGLSSEERETLNRVNAFLAGKKSPPDEVVPQPNGVTPTEEMNASARALLELMAKQLEKQGEPA